MFYTYILVIVLILAVLRSLFNRKKTNNDDAAEEATIDEVAGVSEEYATVTYKNAGIVQTGLPLSPDHSVDFLVTFRYDDQREITLNVPQEIFDEINEGMRDTLITQNNNFLDFAGLAGQDIS